ncbi:hypothetical protein N9604_01160 [Candidatus Pelagibacter sp.]|nr:hypothetical protein [Candidatus Pelagibacter sp.]|tara:strand:+ start:1003 stop:1392 length:390 start_codon:yes stop_codon:yes gene_type:complete
MNFFSQHKIFFYSFNLILISLYFSPTSFMVIFIHNDLYFNSQISPDINIKFSANHIYVFLVFSIVGFLTYQKSNHFIILIIYLIFLSIVLELTHLLISYRGFELADLFGNIIGVLIALTIIYFYKKYKN